MTEPRQRATTGAVAGIPLLLEIDAGLVLRPEPPPPWAGSRLVEEPITLRHAVGDCSTAALRQVLAPSPSSSYYVDEAGEVAVAFRSNVAVMPPVLLRTIRPGLEYEVRYAFPPPQVTRRGRADFSALAFALGQRRRGFFAHSCGFLLPDGAGVLCPGVSGTGKTTLARLLGQLDAGVELLSDDRTVVTRDGEGARLWGSPFPGEAAVAGAGDGPLRAIVFPRHGTTFQVEEVAPTAAARRLRDTLALPLWSPDELADALDLLDRIVSTTLLLEIAYPPTAESARRLVDAVSSRLSALPA